MIGGMHWHVFGEWKYTLTLRILDMMCTSLGQSRVVENENDIMFYIMMTSSSLHQLLQERHSVFLKFNEHTAKHGVFEIGSSSSAGGIIPNSNLQLEERWITRKSSDKLLTLN